jgi:hypothetical protein
MSVTPSVCQIVIFHSASPAQMETPNRLAQDQLSTFFTGVRGHSHIVFTLDCQNDLCFLKCSLEIGP